MTEAMILTDATEQKNNNHQDLRPILQAILRTNETLTAQNKQLYQLLASNQNAGLPTAWTALHPQAGESQPDVLFGPGPRMSRLSFVDRPNNPPDSDDQIWEGILSLSAAHSPDFMEKFFYWDRPDSIEMVLSERNRWTSWSYAASFPGLSKFMKQLMLSHRSSCQVWMDDIHSTSDRRSVAYKEYKRNIRVLWEEIKNRAAPLVATTLSNMEDSDKFSIRLFQIVDLSPFVLSAVLGSTPQSDLSYMAAFIERHLNFSNWGKVSLLKFGDMSWSSYTIEYHFSFYYVSAEYSDSEDVKLDPRKWRRSAPFGREIGAKTRFIHEETASFLLVGHFRDIATCFQLAESYFKFDPYKKSTQPGSFRPYLIEQPPALLLLSWISVGLHHVLWRWQSAIEAVESEIKSSRQIIFLEDRSDLMSDDPQFSLSKTYFWALQAYKLFEQTLLETIATWEKFKFDSLPRLQDPRVSSDDLALRIQDIDDAIQELEAKVTRIRKRMEEVKDLRTGLISASALFDSRTAVRQGENIRLLTYITILFFPLSFATSIFGMQILTPSRHVLSAFIISLPTITLGTALLVFNLEHLLKIWTSMTSFLSSLLRLRMRKHRRKDWRDRAIALHEDMAITKAPVRKAQRQYSGWVYLLFLMEYMLITLPVGELAAVMVAIAILDPEKSPKPSTHQRQTSTQVEFGKHSLEPTSTAQEIRRARIKERIEQSLEDEKKREKARKRREQGPIVATLLSLGKWLAKALRGTAWTFLILVRAIFAPLWIAIILVEYLILLLILSMGALVKPSSMSSLSPWLRSAQILGLGLLLPRRRSSKTLNPAQESPDFEIRTVSRVATKLNVSSPRVKKTTSFNSSYTTSSTTNLVKSPPPPTANKFSFKPPSSPSILTNAERSSGPGRHAEDLLRVAPGGMGKRDPRTARSHRNAFGDTKSEKVEMVEIGGRG
jgi:hypothetical protein